MKTELHVYRTTGGDFELPAFDKMKRTKTCDPQEHPADAYEFNGDPIYMIYAVIDEHPGHLLLGGVFEYWNDYDRHVGTEVVPGHGVRVVYHENPDGLTQREERRLRGIVGGKWQHPELAIRRSLAISM